MIRPQQSAPLNIVVERARTRKIKDIINRTGPRLVHRPMDLLDNREPG